MGIIRVAINGYGTIGRRVADAVTLQPDMELVGISKVQADYKTGFIGYHGYALFGDSPQCVDQLANSGFNPQGTLEDLLEQADIVVDCVPAKLAATNKPRYAAAGVKQLFQGGEKPEVAPFSFNALANFDAVIGAASARVVSCNTTGMTRVLYALDAVFGVERARVVIARKATDPDDPLQGPVDGAVLDPYPAQVPAHHGHDVAEVIPGLHVFVMSARMPMTHAHFHSLIISLKRKEITRAQVMDVLLHTPRTLLVNSTTGVISTMNVFDIGRELGRSRGDIYEGTIWEDSVTVDQGEVYMFMAVHQEAIVIPETVDGIRALMGTSSKEDSMRITDETMGVVAGRLHDVLSTQKHGLRSGQVKAGGQLAKMLP